MALLTESERKHYEHAPTEGYHNRHPEYIEWLAKAVKKLPEVNWKGAPHIGQSFMDKYFSEELDKRARTEIQALKKKYFEELDRKARRAYLFGEWIGTPRIPSESCILKGKPKPIRERELKTECSKSDKEASTQKLKNNLEVVMVKNKHYELGTLYAEYFFPEELLDMVNRSFPIMFTQGEAPDQRKPTEEIPEYHNMCCFCFIHSSLYRKAEILGKWSIKQIFERGYNGNYYARIQSKDIPALKRNLKELQNAKWEVKTPVKVKCFYV